MKRHTVNGFVLLEAMIALAILSSAGVVLVGIVNDGLQLESAMRRRETDIRLADRVLTAMSFLGRSDLDRRLGTREVRGLVVDVSRPTATLYRIAVTNPVSQAPILVTLVYRP
jgi:type II secretory pathway component PulJ